MDLVGWWSDSPGTRVQQGAGDLLFCLGVLMVLVPTKNHLDLGVLRSHRTLIT